MDIEEQTQPEDTTVDLPVADDFDQAFADATADEPVLKDQAPAPKAEEPAPTDAPKGEPPAPKAEEQAPAEPKTEAPAPNTEPPAAKAEEQVPPAPASEPLDPKFLAQAIVEAQAEAAKKTAQPEQPAAPKEFSADDFFTDEDRAALKKVSEDWPDEFKVFGRMAMAHAQAYALNYANQVLAQVDKALAPIVQTLSRSEVNAHRTAIYAAHADYDQVLPEVEKWVGQQSVLVRPALERVLKAGSAQDMVQLVAMYKEAKGQSGAAPASPASTAAQSEPAAPAKPKVAPAAVAATAAVPPTHRPQPTSKDPNDFDQAFDEAMRAAS